MSHLLILLLAAGALADYPSLTDYSNYNSVYTHAIDSDYNSVYAPAAEANLSRATGNQRTWDPAGAGPFKVTLETTLEIPVPDLDSTLTIELPFTWEFGGEAARAGGHFQGRSGKTGSSVQTMDTPTIIVAVREAI